MISKKVLDRIIDINASLQDALFQMDSLDGKLLIVYADGKFKSILSIGDIQRVIIKGKKIDESIRVALRDNIKVARNTDDREEIISVMKNFRMEFMPIIDEVGNLEGAIFWDEIIGAGKSQGANRLSCPVVIMAGGKGTRLKPLTNIIPKALIPIGDKPIIEWILNSFNDAGVGNFWLSVNYKKEMIQTYFSQIGDSRYHIEYFEETTPLGTAGSLHLLNGKLDETFFVTNCDIIVRDDYTEMLRYHKDSRNELTAVAAMKTFTIPYGTFSIGLDGVIDEIKEKPTMNYFINAGMYILEPHLIKEIPENAFFHITELIQKLVSEKRRVGVFPVSQGSWLDVGEWDEYNRTSSKLGFGEFKV